MFSINHIRDILQFVMSPFLERTISKYNDEKMTRNNLSSLSVWVTVFVSYKGCFKNSTQTLHNWISPWKTMNNVQKTVFVSSIVYEKNTKNQNVTWHRRKGEKCTWHFNSNSCIYFPDNNAQIVHCAYRVIPARAVKWC